MQHDLCHYNTMIEYDTIKKFILYQMLAHRYLGSEFPVNIEAFQTLGYKIDLQPTDCEQSQQTQNKIIEQGS